MLKDDDIDDGYIDAVDKRKRSRAIRKGHREKCRAIARELLKDFGVKARRSVNALPARLAESHQTRDDALDLCKYADFSAE